MPSLRSQEIELLGERRLLPDIVGYLLRRLVAEVGHSTGLLRVTNASEQVGDLVRVHARSRHLDWTSPVEVVMTQVECQLLDL